MQMTTNLVAWRNRNLFSILEAGSLKSRHPQGHAQAEGSRGESLFPSQPLAAPGAPRLEVAAHHPCRCLHTAASSPHGSPMCISLGLDGEPTQVIQGDLILRFLITSAEILFPNKVTGPQGFDKDIPFGVTTQLTTEGRPSQLGGAGGSAFSGPR